MAKVDPADQEKQAILAKFKTCAKGAMANLPKLMAYEATKHG
jgi:hypothetical protein